MATTPTRQLVTSNMVQQITTPPKPVVATGTTTSPPAPSAPPQPPILRYKTVNSKYRAQVASEGSELANALKRVPPRVKALGGVIVDDFIEIARLCDKLESRVTLLERQLDEKTKSSEFLNERLEEGRTNFDLLVTRFTNSVEQATQLRKQVDEERVDTEQRHNMAIKQEKLLRDQVAALRRQVDGERMMASHYKKEQAMLKSSVAEMERELATFRTNSTLSGTPEPKSRKDHQRKEEIKKLTAEVEDMKVDFSGAMESRRLLEQELIQLREKSEKREEEYQDVLLKFEASTRVLEKAQERLANANEFLDVNDSLAADDALARMISFNEEVTQISSLLSSRVTFLQDGEDELPNPYAEEEEQTDGMDESTNGRGKDMIHRFLSARFPQLLAHEDIEKRRSYLDLAIRACLVFFAAAIINSGCFGLRQDLDQFFVQVWGIVQSDTTQTIANRWRALTHHSIRASPSFPANRTLVSSMIKSLSSIFRMARVVQPEQTAENFIDDLSAIHASALALEIDFKERVISTNYSARVASVDSPFLAVEMLDVSVFMEGLRDVTSKTGVKTVLATVSLGLSASGVAAGRTRKSMSGKMKNEIRLEPTVLLDAVLP